MVHRDPETGKFVSDNGPEGARYIDTERLHFAEAFSDPASDHSGATGQNYGEGDGWEGIELIEIGDILERDEVAEVIRLSIVAQCSLPSTATSDGTVRAIAQVSLDDDLTSLDLTSNWSDVTKPSGIQATQVSGGGFDNEDAADMLTRALMVGTGAQFSDGASGVGGSASFGHDAVAREWTPGFAPVVDDRDVLYTSGAKEVSNVADQSSHVELAGMLELLVHTDR